MIRALATIIGALLGAGFAFALVGALNILHDGIWMPLALGAAFTCLLPYSRFRSAAFVLSLGAAFTGIAAGVWAYSAERGIVGRFGALADAVPPTLAGVGVLGLVAFLIAVQRSEDRLPSGPILVVMLLGWLVCYFSGGQGGAGSWETWFQSTFGLGPDAAHTLVVGIRKTLHFLFYGFVALFAWHATERDSRMLLFPVLIALSLAIFDEGRQLEHADRTGSLWDVCLDMAGVAAFLLFSVVRYRRRRNVVSTSHE